MTLGDISLTLPSSSGTTAKEHLWPTSFHYSRTRSAKYVYYETSTTSYDISQVCLINIVDSADVIYRFIAVV